MTAAVTNPLSAIKDEPVRVEVVAGHRFQNVAQRFILKDRHAALAPVDSEWCP